MPLFGLACRTVYMLNAVCPLFFGSSDTPSWPKSLGRRGEEMKNKGSFISYGLSTLTRISSSSDAPRSSLKHPSRYVGHLSAPQPVPSRPTLLLALCPLWHQIRKPFRRKRSLLSWWRMNHRWMCAGMHRAFFFTGKTTWNDHFTLKTSVLIIRVVEEEIEASLCVTSALSQRYCGTKTQVQAVVQTSGVIMKACVFPPWLRFLTIPMKAALV